MTEQLPHPCIEWEGWKSGGYGYTSLAPNTKMVGAHRVAYCVEHGLDLSAIEGKVIRHKCDNPLCVQPSHLEVGTYQDNMNDKMERGRHRSLTGSKHQNSKLTESIVLSIRERYKPRCKVNGSHALAKEFGVNQGLISQVVNRKIWRHI